MIGSSGAGRARHHLQHEPVGQLLGERSLPLGHNSAMESFLKSLKIERTDGKIYRTRADAMAEVFDYIERFYNSKPRHSTLGHISPIQFEQQRQLA